MGPDLELKAKSDGITASCIKENGGLSVDSKYENLKCESSHEDHALVMENHTAEPLLADGNKDGEVNVTESTTSDGNGLVQDEGQYATESLSSSSFDGTDSSSEDESNTSNAEMASRFHGYNSSLAIDGLNDLFRMRKKRLTSHWRTYIHPLMWRCKWVELQVKKFRSQALKYDRELANHDKKQHYLVEKSQVEDFGMKSLPYTCDGLPDKVFRRKRRRRVEESTDVTAYMSHHDLFSYFENRIHTADGAYAGEDWGNQDKINGNAEFGANDERLWLESVGGDNSLEELLRMIGLLESQVTKLKTRLHKVIDENAGRFSSADDLGLVLPPDLTSSARSPASPPNSGDKKPVGSSEIASHMLSEYNMGNVVMPRGAVISRGEKSYMPDVIESKDQSQVGGAHKKAEDEILIHGERLKEERDNFDEAHIQIMEKPLVAKEEPESTFSTVLPGPDLQTDNHPAPKVRSIATLTAPKGRRKRRRRKFGPRR